MATNTARYLRHILTLWEHYPSYVCLLKFQHSKQYGGHHTEEESTVALLGAVLVSPEPLKKKGEYGAIDDWEDVDSMVCVSSVHTTWSTRWPTSLCTILFVVLVVRGCCWDTWVAQCGKSDKEMEELSQKGYLNFNQNFCNARESSIHPSILLTAQCEVNTDSD